MSVRTDVINLNVNVNGNDAQNKLNDLRKKASDVKLEMQNLKKGTQDYIDKAKELKAIEHDMAELKKTIGITSLSQKELVAELNKLKALRGSVIPFSDEYKQLSKSIKEVENRLYDVRNGVQGFSSFFSKIKDEVKQFGMLAAGYLGFEFLSNQFTNIIQGAGRLSDQLADIRRVTGMTEAEVKNLNKSLGDLNTRTSTSGLRDIAVIAGKLGVAKDDILSFVQATDQLVVALGDELGNADEITTQLGKIIGVFDKGDGTVTGEKLTHIGNAIVDLANKGVASGGFIVDFTQRLAGLAKTANVGLDEVMGLAAGLEESGQKAESSSTAIIKVLGEIGKDVPKYAKIANVSVEDFSKTLKEKPIEALIQVSQGLASGKTSFEEISKAFNAAGEDGARVITTLGVIGGKADWFREKIAATGSALENTNQINQAFALKNMTLGATLDMLSKEFNKLMTSEGITNFLKDAVVGALNFIRFLKELPNWLRENRTAIIATTTIVAMYVAAKTKATQAIWLNRAAILLETAADKLEAAQKVASTIITRTYATAKGLLTGQITIATVAQRAWNAALMANPLMWVVGIVGGLITVISLLTSKVKELAREQKLQADLQAKITELTGEEESKARALFAAIKDTNTSYAAKQQMLKQLIALNPQYLSGLTLENIATEKGKKLLDDYILNLRKAGEEKARQALIDEKIKRQQEIKQEMGKVEGPSFFDNYKDVGEAVGLGKGGAVTQIVNLSKEYQALDKDIQDLMKSSTEAMVKDLSNKKGAIADAASSNIRTIKTIKDEIDKLDKAYQEIDVKNIAALKQNRNERKKLQDELDALENKKSSSQKKEESAFDKLKKEAKQFEEELKKFKTDANKYGKTADEKELIDLQQKFEKLTQEALKYYKANVTSHGVFTQQKQTIDEAYNLELNKIFQQRFEKNAAKEYEDSLKLDADFRDQLKQAAAKQYTDGVLSKEQYEEKLKQIELDAVNNRVWIANDYKATVKKAAEDLVSFHKAAEERKTDISIAEFEKRKAYTEQERLAEAKLKTLTRKGDDKLQAQKDLLMLEFDLKTAAWNKESQQYKLAVQERLDAEKELERKAREEKINQIQQYFGYLQEAFTALNTIMANRENKMLRDEEKRNESKKSGYKKQLENKLISQKVHDAKIAAAEEELDKKKKEIARKQAERERAAQLFAAVINTASAVVKALPNFVLAGIVAALGALQIGAIASAPLPEFAEGGWVRYGDKHSAASGGIDAKIERDEAVMNAKTMTDPNIYSLSGTPAQITGALNGLYGKAWAPGARFNDTMPWLNNSAQSINSNMPNVLAAANKNNNEALEYKVDKLIDAFQKFPKEVKGKWVIKDLDEAKLLYEKSKKTGSINQ